MSPGAPEPCCRRAAEPVVLGGFALVFVVLSFSMFGFYELQMPTALQSRLSDTASHQKAARPAA